MIFIKKDKYVIEYVHKNIYINKIINLRLYKNYKELNYKV